MATRQALLDWLNLFYDDPVTVASIFQNHFSDLPDYPEASWRIDRIFYYEPEYEYSIMPWEGYLEIFYQDELVFTVIRFAFTRVLRPFFPIRILVTTIFYMELDLRCSSRSFMQRHSILSSRLLENTILKPVTRN